MRSAWLIVVLAACGPAPLPETAADGCYQVATTNCDRISACGTLKSTVGQCRADGVAACCAGADCSRTVRACESGRTCCADADCKVIAVNVKVFTDCQAGIEQLSCGQLAAGLVPAGCVAK